MALALPKEEEELQSEDRSAGRKFARSRRGRMEMHLGSPIWRIFTAGSML